MTAAGSTEETKFIYYIDEEETPYLVKLNIAPHLVTLSDFKNALNRPHSKFFFKSLDDDFGVVKEEIFDDNAILPCFNGRVVSWLVTADGSTISVSSGDDGSHRNKHSTLGTDHTNHPAHSDPNSTSGPLQQQNHTTAAAADSTSPTLSAGTKTHRVPEPDTESVHSASQDRIAPLRSFHNYKSGGRHFLASGGGHYGHSGHCGSHCVTSGIGRQRHHRGGAAGSGTYETPSSMMSSDLESTSFFDSEDDSSRFSSVTGTTLSSRRYGRVRQRRRRRRPPPISRASSFSSITDSTMSLNIIAVTLNMDTVNFLGISIVGQSNKAGDGGIYVGSIMKGGAVAQDRRIEPGDMILEVNGISFEEMSNDDAVRTLREQVQRPGPITLVVAKCWDPNPHEGYFTIPRQEPIRPIDPRAWVLHTNAMTVDNNVTTMDSQLMLNGGTPMTGPSSGGESSSTLSPSGAAGLTPGMSMGTLTSGQTSMPLGTSAAAYNMAALLAASQQQHQLQQQQQQQQQQQHSIEQHHHMIHPQQQQPFYPAQNMMLAPGYPRQVAPSVITAPSSLPDMERYSEPIPLTVGTDPFTVVSAMRQPDSGLEIRDRTWLKLTVPDAFIGSDLVDWLYRHLDGFVDRRSARKYAASLLKSGYIRHTVNKTNFSEQCYYVFNDIVGRVSCLSLEEVDSVSEVGTHPLIVPSWGQNTTSTNLTVGGTPNAAQLTEFLMVPGSGHQPHHNPTVALKNGSVRTGECASSCQYSSVPPVYHPPVAVPAMPMRHPLINEGTDDVTMAHQMNRGTGGAMSNNLPAYSDSSSSTDSDLNQLNPETQRFTKPINELTPSVGLDPIFMHTSMDSKTPHLRQSTRPPIPSSLTRTQPGKPNDVASTASSSTSDGREHNSLPTQSDKRLRPNTVLQSAASCKSSSSSSSSSCTPGFVDRRSGPSNHRLTQPHLLPPPPPPPPPRISTAVSGFTLTNRP